MTIDVELRKKSGKRDLPESDLRVHCVSVRLNAAELATLDKVRSRFQRGEAMRMVVFSNLPTPKIVPEVNRELSINCGRVFGNLATVATAMRHGEFVTIDEIEKVIYNLRSALEGVEK